jgi:hypothetical protein
VLLALVQAIAVTLSPSAVTLTPGGTLQFTATVTGTSNTGINWTLNPAIGSIDANGRYTAPTTITAQTTVTVTATSTEDNTQAASASITLNPPANQTLATFQLGEPFGVSWPEQPIEFRHDGGLPQLNNTRMIGPGGIEVPFQWVSSCSDTAASKGCILVRSDLPANANYTWTLESGVAPSATPVHPVQINQVGSNWEITNGLTGVRIISASGNPSPWNRAPIQGVMLPDGTWTGAGASPNYLYSQSLSWEGNVGAAMRTAMYLATGYSVSVTDSGPMKTVLKVTYTFNRPKYYYSSTIINSAGVGHYTLIVTLYSNSKSILIDEDTDMQMAYYLPVFSELSPDLVRFRGHGGYWDPICGYESPGAVTGASNASPVVITTPAGLNLSNGQVVGISGVAGNTAANGTFYAKTTGYSPGQFALYSDSGLTAPVAGTGAYTGGGTVKPNYRGQSINPAPDGYLDLTYSSDRPAGYYCGAAAYKRLLSAYPAAEYGTGWYSMMYQSAAGSSGPVVGFYTGRASQQLSSATGPSMPGMFSSNNHWISGKQDAGIELDAVHMGPDARVAPLIHRNWGIWVGIQADLQPVASHQAIADDQNSLAGINLSRLYTYSLAYSDPAGGWQWLNLPAASANQIVSWVRDGTSVCGSTNCYYNLLYNSDPYARAIFNMWKGNSSAAVQSALDTVTTFAATLGQTLANGDNHFDNSLHYYQLGLQTSPNTVLLNAILMDSNSTSTQKAVAKKYLALFGSILWDNDWFPIDNDSGASVGLANQIQQYLQYRTGSAAAAPSNPYLASKLTMAAGYPVNDLATYFSSSGAAAGSTHYQGAFFEPLIMNYQTLSLDGVLSMSDPKWAAYANWELSIQTPPEPRFGNVRKGYSNGDGATEADVRPGLLATALSAINPTLAGNLMWAWRQSNSATTLTEGSFFTSLSIDPTIPSITPALGSLNIPGYHSAERHGFGTPNETAVWFINGGFYSTGGHRHYDDGQVSIYGHSAPLAIDWNANLYSPETPGRFMHNSIVYDTELTHPWSADNPGLSDAATLMQNPTNTEFETFPNSTTSTGTFTATDGTVWTRTVRTMAYNPRYPIIYVTDAFSGPGSSAGKTLTWNLMATGPVSTPAGRVTPTTRFSSGCQSVPGQFPSNGTVFPLGSGLQQFSFTGATWLQHPAGGINWDLFTVSNAATQQFMIGSWGHGCHPSREASEYSAANGAAFAESQHILRVHDSGPFTTIILPYRKTEVPARTVAQQSCGTQIQQGTETTCFNNSAATYSNGTQSILSVYDSSTQSAFGATASGGSQEVSIQSGKIVWTISGADSGTRTLTLPGTWHPSPAVSQSEGAYSYPWAGGAQATPVTIVFTP